MTIHKCIDIKRISFEKDRAKGGSKVVTDVSYDALMQGLSRVPEGEQVQFYAELLAARLASNAARSSTGAASHNAFNEDD